MTMKVIYQPKGRAREYSPLALNYYNGCDHACQYCYVPSIKKKTQQEYSERVFVRKNLLADLTQDLQKNSIKDQVLLCFAGDPYCQYNELTRVTSQVLAFFLVYKVPVAILTKGGTRAQHDMDLIKRFGKNIKMGATLVFIGKDQEVWEPGAQSTEERIEALETFKKDGVRTWLSMEPVMDPKQSLEIIKRTLHCVDEYKLGKINHYREREKGIDWRPYLSEALGILRKAGKAIYVKNDLAEQAPDTEFEPAERDMDLHALKGWQDIGAGT